MNPHVYEVEPEVEEVVPADAWAAAAADDHAALHQEIQDKTLIFLMKGGRVQVVPHGATGLSDGLNLSFPRGLADSSKAAQDMAKRRHKYNQASMANRLKRDEESVQALRAALPLATSLTDLAKRSGVTPARTGRFLKAFFKDDPQAQQFMPMDRDAKRKAYEAELLPRIRQAKADGLIGLQFISKHLGVSFETIKFMDEHYNLQLPRGDRHLKRRYKKQCAEAAK